jgi:hypothetical protein
VTLTSEQREALTDALVEDWKESIVGDFRHLDGVLDDILVHGRIGYADFTDAELLKAAGDAELDIYYDITGEAA